MALLETCFCCTLAIAAGFIAVYLLIGYVIAFAFELLWLLEADNALPLSATVLCAEYFIMSLFAAFLVHGLATKNTVCLVAWMFTVTVLSFPEAGMVIYMSMQYWSIESLYGMTELVCWLARVLANVFGVVIVQSLFSTWKEEQLVIARIQQINMTSVSQPPSHIARHASDIINVHNTEKNIQHFTTLNSRGYSNPSMMCNASVPNNLAAISFDGLAYCTTQSEFNASIYISNITNRNINIAAAKRTQSLMDLREMKEEAPALDKMYDWKSWSSQSLNKAVQQVIPTYTLSFDRRLNPRGSKSVDCLDLLGSLHPGRNNSFEPLAGGAYELPIYYGPIHGPDFLVYKRQISKNSLSNTSDDMHKYRDVAL